MQICRNLVAILDADEVQIRQAIVSFPIGFDGWASSKAATGADARGTQQNPDASRNAVWPRR
jgi:hypothetical protein